MQSQWENSLKKCKIVSWENIENHLNIFYLKLQDKDCYGMSYNIIEFIGWPERTVRLACVIFKWELQRCVVWHNRIYGDGPIGQLKRESKGPKTIKLKEKKYQEKLKGLPWARSSASYLM